MLDPNKLEIDYGTPASTSTEMVTLEIDGQEVTVPKGTSLMRAAMEAGHQIPKLCATDMVDAFGSCRLCLVEIQGRAGTPASCTTPVAAGMVVYTQTDKLKRLRNGGHERHRLLDTGKHEVGTSGSESLRAACRDRLVIGDPNDEADFAGQKVVRSRHGLLL